MARNWQELYEDEVSTATPSPGSSWQQNYEPGLSGPKQAVEPNLIPQLGLATQGVQYGLGRLKAWGQGWDDWTQRQRKIQSWNPLSGSPPPQEALDEMAGGGSFGPGGVGGVVRGVTPTDNTFVNYIRGQFPKLMKRVDELPDIQFTRGMRHITKRDAPDEALHAAHYRHPWVTEPLPGGSIELSRPYQWVEAEKKWKVPFGPQPATQDPIPAWPRYKQEITDFVHEALHALYYHKNKGLSDRGIERLGPEWEGSVPSMTFQQAKDFLDDVVKKGYMSEARMKIYMGDLAEPRHGAMDAQSLKIVRDVFDPTARENPARTAKRVNEIQLRLNALKTRLLKKPGSGMAETAEQRMLRNSINNRLRREAGLPEVESWHD